MGLGSQGQCKDKDKDTKTEVKLTVSIYTMHASITRESIVTRWPGARAHPLTLVADEVGLLVGAGLGVLPGDVGRRLPLALWGIIPLLLAPHLIAVPTTVSILPSSPSTPLAGLHRTNMAMAFE